MRAKTRRIATTVIVFIFIALFLSSAIAVTFFFIGKSQAPPINPLPQPVPNPIPIPTPSSSDEGGWSESKPAPQPPSPSGLGPTEALFYRSYLAQYLSLDGAVRSNAEAVSWCPNEGIGCDSDITSEGIARLAMYAVSANDKSTFDREVNYYYGKMKHPTTGHMMWKLDKEGIPTSGGGGQNSAVDSELIFIDALLIADQKWGADSAGRSYKTTARIVMNSLKGGIIEKNGQQYIPFCMYSAGNETRACVNQVFLGYLNLRSLKKMCGVDSFWCSVYQDSKSLMLGAVQDGGGYSVYDIDNNEYSWEFSDIHTNWMLKHLAQDNSYDAIKAFYEEGRRVFYEQDRKICQEFKPGSGCKVADAPMRVYGHYLEIASSIGDTQFRDDLVNYLNEKRLGGAEGTPILASKDNYGNIVILQAYADARKSGARI